MKFSISSLNPFAWVKQEPMTANQIRLYDLGQDIAEADEQLLEIELHRIEWESYRAGLIAQKKFILEGENQLHQFPVIHKSA